jgi:hypothetical protein
MGDNIQDRLVGNSRQDRNNTYDENNGPVDKHTPAGNSSSIVPKQEKRIAELSRK